MFSENKILVIDDENKILEVIASYLQKEGFQVIVADNGEDGLRLFYAQCPSLVILDLMLPDLSGEEICRAIRSVSNIPIIMLTAKSGEPNVLKGLDVGADDYITKPFSPKEVVARVRAILRRYNNEFSEQMVFDNGNLIIDLSRRNVKVNNTDIKLTQAEFKLLVTLAGNSKKIFSREELVNLVLGYDYEGLDRTIDVHIKNLRAKIEQDNKSPHYILTIFGIGYKFGGE